MTKLACFMIKIFGQFTNMASITMQRTTLIIINIINLNIKNKI